MRKELVKDAREALLWTLWRVQLTIPSVIASGEEFSLRISAIAPDGLPSPEFDREIFFGESPGIEGLPASVKLDGSGDGTLEIGGLKVLAEGTAFITARPAGCPMDIFSNPAWVFDEPPWRIFWGDLHVHTTYSNCSPWACKDPAFCYEYARDVTHLDFCAAADHLRGIASDKSRWPRLRKLVKEYDGPGRFIPFLAFESSHKAGYGGDINAYFLGTEVPFFWLDREDMRGTSPEVRLRQLWDFLDSTGAEYFTVPHHTGRRDKYRSFDDEDYDPEREPLFEIFSMWGSSESRWNALPLRAGNSDKPCYFTDALQRGCRYGVIASSDDHRTLPGGEGTARRAAGFNEVNSKVHHGLAAVRADELSREAVWRALKSRSCYGTTMARTLVDFRIGSAEMGEAIPVEHSDSLRSSRTISVKIASTPARRLDVTLVRNGSPLEMRTIKGGNAEITFTDTEKLDDAAIREARFHPEPFVAYYVRVEETFGHTQWTSPVWLDLV